MPITATWDTEEKHAICISITGVWSWNQMWDTLDTIITLIEEVDYTVTIIIPDADYIVRTLPPGLLTQVGAFNRKRHKRSGLMIFIDEKRSNAGSLWYRMVGTVYPQFHDRFQFVDQIEIARQIARERFQQQIKNSPPKAE